LYMVPAMHKNHFTFSKLDSKLLAEAVTLIYTQHFKSRSERGCEICA
jgi:hypothetical protein